MKVVHFITDDKFFNGTIAFLDEMENLENHYYIHSHKVTFKHIQVERVQRADDALVKRIISNPEECDVIVIHNLLSLPCKYIKAIDKRIKVVWFSFGSDIYSNSYPQFPLIKLRNRIKPGTFTFKSWIIYNSKRFVKEYVFRFFRVRDEERKSFVPAIHRIDYYSGVFPTEYDLIKSNNPFFRAKQVSYYYVSDAIKTLYRKENIDKEPRPVDRNIQVGNCAAIVGNHRNTFNWLSRLTIGDRKIITPLSYGGNQTYVKSVCRSGYKLFGDNFNPMISFMSRDKYFNLLNSVSHAIYNIEQQGAAGNIRMGLWNGVKIFLPKNSMGFKYFKQQGFYIYSIEEDLTQDGIDNGLTDEQIVHNKRLMSETTSYEILRDKVIETFETIHKDIMTEKTKQ